jgi:cell division septal protein FtsQ
LFGFSIKNIETRLESEFSELADVSVSRGWNRGVLVEVRRRIPVARVPDGEGWSAMDDAGALFPLDATRFPPEKLTVLVGSPTGLAARPYLDFLRRIRSEKLEWAGRTRKIKIGTGTEATLLFSDETPVFWGDVREKENVFHEKAARLDSVLKNELLKAGADYIRFVNDYRLVVKPKNGDEQTIPETP